MRDTAFSESKILPRFWRLARIGEFNFSLISEWGSRFFQLRLHVVALTITSGSGARFCMGRKEPLPTYTYPGCVNSFDRHGSFIIG